MQAIGLAYPATAAKIPPGRDYGGRHSGMNNRRGYGISSFQKPSFSREFQQIRVYKLP